MEEIKQMDLESKDLVAERVEQLKRLFPEVATEGDGSIDFEKLRLILGDEVEDGDERYSFTWPGKRDAIRQSQTVTTATLRPCPEESVNWDTTENLYIEGDNLEVLKLLQRSYHGKVKMIYIDPPYNTGHDFVYSDKFSDSIDNYKEQTGLSYQSNVDTSGSYHSNWCSMMYARIKLARELLMDDGAIFISIDDNEQRNIRIICDEIFGPNNFYAQIVWQKRTSPDARFNLGTAHDYVVVYAKNHDLLKDSLNKIELSDDRKSQYKNPDNDPRGPWASVDITGQTGHATESQYYEITTPNGTKMKPPQGRCWALSESTFNALKEDNRLWFGEDGGNRPRQKKFLSESEGGNAWTWWSNAEVGHNQEAQKELKALFDGRSPFDTPKPVRLLRRMLDLATIPDCLVLDFFSGSATLAQSVLEKNLDDGSSIHFILVQLPEPQDGAYADLCKVGEERIRRAGAKIAVEVEESNKQLKLGEDPKQLPDIGFRVLKLDESGIAKPEPGQFLIDCIKEGRTDQDIIFEMMLKWGMELSYPIEETEIGGYPCYSVAYDELICCMKPGLTVSAIEEIAALEPRRVFMLDSILDDTLKLNALQIFKRVEEKTQQKIDLRTV